MTAQHRKSLSRALFSSLRFNGLRFPFALQLLLVIASVLAINFLFDLFVETPRNKALLAERYNNRDVELAEIMSRGIAESLSSEERRFPTQRFNELATAPFISEALAVDCDSNIYIAKNSLLTGTPLLTAVGKRTGAHIQMDTELYVRVASNGAPISRVLPNNQRYLLNPIPCITDSPPEYTHAVLIMFFDRSHLINQDMALANKILTMERMKWGVFAALIFAFVGVSITSRLRRLKGALETAASGDYSIKYGGNHRDEIDLFGEAYDQLVTSFKKTLSDSQSETKKYILGHATFEQSPIAICIFSSEQRALDINPSYENLTGYTRNEMIGRSLISILPEDLISHREKDFVDENLLRGSRIEAWGYKKNGSRYRKTIELFSKKDSKGVNECYFYVERDISEEYDQRKKLELIAKTDSLTGIYNRRQFDCDLTSCFRSGRTDFALGILNLDNIKEINSEYGIRAGDRIIKEAGRRLLLAVSGTRHNVYRIEGDEFFVLLKGVASEQDLERRAKAILSNLSGEMNDDDWQIDITAGMGVAMFNEQSHKTSHAFVRDADLALQHGKDSGHSSVVIAHDFILSSQRRRASISLALKSSKLTEQLQLLYSPKIDIQNGILAGAESTVRWYYPQLGYVPNDEFILTAERTGDMIRISDWMLEQALVDAAKFAEKIPGFQTTINITPRQLLKPLFVENFIAQLRAHKIPTDGIGIEIADWNTINNNSLSFPVLQSLRSAGVRIQINDFGIGYSSFSELQKLPLDALKIDKSFIKDIDNNQANLSIIRTIISLAHIMKISVIAEGVESSLQLNALKELGCDFCQGYLYSEPTSLTDTDSAESITANWQKSIDSVLS